MAAKVAKAAHRGDGGDLRNSQSGRAEASDISQVVRRPQDRLIAAVQKHGRARFEIALRSFRYDRRVTLRLCESNGQGGYKKSGPCVAIAPSKLREVIEALQLAEATAKAEGLL
jgi:hypothetical protein